MNLNVLSGNIAQAHADVIIVNLFEGVTHPAGGTGAVNSALGGVITEELLRCSAFTGKLGTALALPTFGRIPARYVVITGLGEALKLDSHAIRRASAVAIRECMKLRATSVATIIHGAGIGGYNIHAAARLLIEGTLLGAYQFKKHKKADPNGPKTPEYFTIIENDATRIPVIDDGLRYGLIIAQGVNQARDWVFDSANHVTPSFLVQQAQAIPGLECKVLDTYKIKELGMNAFYHVAKGSDESPFLIHLSYKPKGIARKKVALIGKGITFDSGGLSLKPPTGQETMKMDMAGAAAVLATMSAIAELGDLDVQVDAFIPTCENMPSGHAGRPGDIVRAMNGKTIEINNTDAEGRLILCDAITYAQQVADPDEVIDIATLTGACVVALGSVAAGIMGNSDLLVNNIIAAGDHAGEKFWRLPLYEEYKETLKSEVADLINAGSKGKAGTSSAAKFLEEFIEEDTSWAHLDIAGPAYVEFDSPEVPKGATGFGARSLLYYLYEL